MKQLIYNWLFLPPETPLLLVPLFGLVTTFFYFALVMTLKKWLIARGWGDNKLARVFFFLFGGKFLRQDVLANLVCFSPLALHFPNRFDEGWTITSHANAIIKHYYGRRLSWRKRWALGFSLFICKHLGNIDEWHCSNYRRVTDD